MGTIPDASQATIIIKGKKRTEKVYQQNVKLRSPCLRISLLAGQEMATGLEGHSVSQKHDRY